MDVIAVILNILLFSWVIAIVVSVKRKPIPSHCGYSIPSVSAETVKTQEQEHVFPEQAEEQKTEAIPQKPVQRGKFPASVDKLSEKELRAKMYAALKDRPEEVIKIATVGFCGGETFWLPGHRIDREFTYSHDGTDLFPVTVYYS